MSPSRHLGPSGLSTFGKVSSVHEEVYWDENVFDDKILNLQPAEVGHYFRVLLLYNSYTMESHLQ